MTHPTQDKQELLKQNFELTLIIIFIGLAFGLVGLIVSTAAVMSVVVISVGVIVGFVSYRDAFVPRIPDKMTVTSPVVTPPTVSAPVGQKLPTTSQAPKPAPLPTPKPAQIVEPLPRLPKIQRLPESTGTTFPSQAKPANIASPKPIMPVASDPLQTKSVKPRKPRSRKTVEIPSLNDKNDA